MDINFKWPGDADHESLEALFRKYDQMERNFLVKALALDPRLAFLEGEV